MSSLKRCYVSMFFLLLEAPEMMAYTPIYAPGRHRTSIHDTRADIYRQLHDNVALLGPHRITGLEIHFLGLVQSQILIA